MKKILITLLTITTTLVYSQSDNCTGAPTLTVGTSCNGIAYNVSNSFNNTGPDPTCGGSNEDDGWFTFIATSTSTIIEGSVSSGDDLILTVYNGGCGSLNEIGCSNSGGNAQNESMTVTTVVGVQYWIMLVSDGNSAFSGNVCVYTPSAANNDCSGATPVCSNTSFTGNSSGAGTTQELNAGNAGCMSIEHQSSWYTFTINTSGTLDFTISPVNGTDDYDFALWGPNPNCPPTSTPLRCSWAAGGGNTGLSNGSGDNTEGAFGDRFVEDINVTAGETYILLIDNFSSTTSPFNLTWGGSATLDCTVLPIELSLFSGQSENNYNLIKWTTVSEINNDYFLLERSNNGYNWEVIHTENGAGNSSITLDYRYLDYTRNPGVNYYKLSQVDFDGKSEEFDIISVYNHVDKKEIIKVVNFMGQEIDPEKSKGLVIYYYSDGTYNKVFK